jgi:hypothetical protein
MIRSARNTRSPFTHEPPALTILTGDNADSQQYNETRWFIDVLDGGTFVDPDSGIPTTAYPDPHAGVEVRRRPGRRSVLRPRRVRGGDGR